jgi:hypothetical protein
MTDTLAEIEKVLIDCVREVMKRDAYLLQNNVGERAIAGKLACYMASRLPNMDVDIEYNRFAVETPEKVENIVKRLHWNRNNSGEEEHSVFPDIIIHKRGSQENNELVIEIKSGSCSPQNKENDHFKLKAFTNQAWRNEPYYKLGVFIHFTLHETELTWFENDREIHSKQMSFSLYG